MKNKDFTRRRFLATVSAGSAVAVVSSVIPTFGNINNTGKLAIPGGAPVAPAKVLPESQPWWEREGPLTILDDGSSYTGVISSSPDMDIPLKASLAFNTEHMHVMAMAGGLDDQEFYFSSKVAGKKNQDYMSKYLPEVKKSGLRVIVYMNIHWFRKPFGDQHRDWLQIDEGGEPINEMYGLPGTTFCMNSPWREWIFQIVRDLCAYPIDGIFWDGTSFRNGTCYCRYCQEKFQKANSRKLPSSKKQRYGEDARDLLNFKVESQLSFLRDGRQIIKSINTDIAFYKNGAVLGGNWVTGKSNRTLIAEQDMLGSEGGYGDVSRPLWKVSLTARLLETQSGGKPRVIFSSGRPSPWQFSNHSEPELRLLCAGTVANAASTFFFMSPNAMKRPQMKALADMNRFIARNAAYYRGTRSEAAIAVVWSDTTANFYSGAGAQILEDEKVKAASDIGNLEGEFSGLAETILRSHTPFDVIDDVTLEQEKLDRYATIVLPNVACMSDKTVGRLKEYVHQGGNLFATFETSLYDDIGVRRPDFALAELFGVSDARKIVGPLRFDYMQPRMASPLLEGWPKDMVPAPTYHLRVVLNGGETLANFTKPLTGMYAGIPQPSDDPAIVVHHYGKGKVVYSSGDIGNALNSSRFPEWCRLIENVLRESAPSPVVLEDAPGTVEVVLRSQEDGRRLLLHLVNFTGEMTRPIRKIVPLQNVVITVQTKGEVKRIHTLMQPGTLVPLKANDGEVQFMVPHIGEYEVVVLEK